MIKMPLIFVSALLVGSILHADDTALKVALDKANRGDTQEAISDLQTLKQANPSDARVALSLGLLYQSTDQHDLAISELERARSLEPSLQGTYALGLLYESKWIKTDQADWKQKAITAWETYLKDSPLDDAHRSHAEHHLRKLKTNE